MSIIKSKDGGITISKEDCLGKYKGFKLDGRLVINSQDSEYENYICFISGTETRKNFLEMLKNLTIDKLFTELEKIYEGKNEYFFQFDICKIDNEKKVLHFYDK